MPRIEHTLINTFVDVEFIYFLLFYREKAAFTFGIGLWQSIVMSTFKGSWKVWWDCMVYFNDLIAMGNTFEEYVKTPKEMFQRLRETKVELTPKKCPLFQMKVT